VEGAKPLIPLTSSRIFPILKPLDLINLLDRKGIITKKELREEMRKVQAILPKSERVVKG
jgi:hypothetical protein